MRTGTVVIRTAWSCNKRWLNSIRFNFGGSLQRGGTGRGSPCVHTSFGRPIQCLSIAEGVRVYGMRATISIIKSALYLGLIEHSESHSMLREISN